MVGYHSYRVGLDRKYSQSSKSARLHGFCIALRFSEYRVYMDNCICENALKWWLTLVSSWAKHLSSWLASIRIELGQPVHICVSHDFWARLLSSRLAITRIELGQLMHICSSDHISSLLRMLAILQLFVEKHNIRTYSDLFREMIHA